MLDRIEKKKKKIREKRRTVVTEGTGRECFVNGDDVGVSDTRPLFDGLEGSLIHKTEIFFFLDMLYSSAAMWKTSMGHT